jgi:hypothetical protein
MIYSMGKIKFSTLTEASFVPHAAADRGSRRSVFGGPDELELFELHQGPNTRAEPHAHVDDEIIYVVEGSLIFGNREFGPGSAVLIPAWTLYSFVAGGSGVRLLNFRPRTSERRVIWKDEFLSERGLVETVATSDTQL